MSKMCFKTLCKLLIIFQCQHSVPAKALEIHALMFLIPCIENKKLDPNPKLQAIKNKL